MSADARRSLPPQFLVHHAEKRDEVHFEGVEPVAQLDEVKSPFSAFDIAHGRLAPTQQVRQIRLAQVLRFAQASEHGEEDLVVAAVQSLGHGTLSALQP